MKEIVALLVEHIGREMNGRIIRCEFLRSRRSVGERHNEGSPARKEKDQVLWPGNENGWLSRVILVWKEKLSRKTYALLYTGTENDTDSPCVSPEITLAEMKIRVLPKAIKAWSGIQGHPSIEGMLGPTGDASFITKDEPAFNRQTEDQKQKNLTRQDED